MDKLNAIKVFKRVVELESFTKAADDLMLSRAAISKNIAELEQFLGCALIKRTTRTMHLTPAGLDYYQSVCQLLEMWDIADENAMSSSSSMKGEFTVSIPVSLGLLSIQPKLCQFAARYPDLQLNIILSDEKVDLVSRGVDVAIRGSGLLKDSSLKAKKLHSIERVLCATPTYLADAHQQLSTPHDIEHHHCLVYSLSSSPTTWLFYNDQEEAQIDVRHVKMQANNTVALKHACLADFGLMLAPKVMVIEEISDGRLVSVLDDWRIPNHDLYAVYPTHKEHSNKVKSLINFMSEQLL